jgi:hypothetical protein
MPHAFASLSHDDIAFGFFHAETDLLILDRYFVFAGDFCRWVAELADAFPGKPLGTAWEVRILKDEDIGSLLGAVHGTDFTGLMGDIYLAFPLPADTKNCGQNPEGHRTRGIIEEIIDRYSPPVMVSILIDADGSTVEIGDYLFTRENFQQMLRYVWTGGYADWKAGRRPSYVTRMVERIGTSRHPLFEGILS